MNSKLNTYDGETINKTQRQLQHLAGMNSYTLFGHIVRHVGSINCSRAHVELQALGILPEANWENPTPLQQDDAHVRAAFALWSGLAIDPINDGASKRFFEMVASGRASVPIADDGENFILKLAQILKDGPIAMGVLEVRIGQVFITDYGLNAVAFIINADGTGTKYQVGEPLQWSGNMAQSLDDLKLLAIHRDLRETPRVWPDEGFPQTATLKFIGGLIQIDNYGRKNTIYSGQASAAQ